MRKRAFSLIELSIVVLIIGIVIAAITQGSRVVTQMRLASAKAQTESAPINGIKSLVLWWESVSPASFITTEAVDGNSISTWYDISTQLSLKTDIVQATSANKPTYKLTGMNNLPAISFDGTNDYLRCTNMINLNMSLFMVLQTSNQGSGGSGAQAYATTGILWSDVGGSASDIIPLAIGGGYPKFFTGDSETTITASTIVSNNRPHIINIVRDASSLARTIYIDGTSSASDSNTTSVSLSSNAIMDLGGNTLDGRYYTGLVGEVIIYERVLKTDERKAVEKYLGKKWGISTP